MKKLLLLAAMLCVLSWSYTQTEEMEHISASISKTQSLAQIHEIYGQDYPPADSGTERALIDLLQDRVELMVSPPDEKDYPLLSSLPLMNSVNPAITAFNPQTFNVSTFNPLRYGWNFFDSNMQVFRIDGTDYLLVVQPQIIGE